MELLRVEQLTKQYGSGANKVLALDHVSFSVENSFLKSDIDNSFQTF